MEFVDPDDGPPSFREPPSPDDRLWRHPSEVGATVEAAAGSGRRADRPMWLVAGASALAASLLTTGLVIVVLEVRHNSPAPSAAVERQMVRPRSASTVAMSPVVDIAERARPAIVQIQVEVGGHPTNGSGVVFRSDGYILTNSHVVRGAASIGAVLANGRDLVARLVGDDPETDVAVVKVEGGPFSVATLGTAVDLRVGQPAVAIGSPLGPAGGPSVTSGVVSALHREIRPAGTDQALVDMVQTDAPISPGSSGGALLDGNGGVIGITTAVAASDAGGNGLGFAIPIDVARSIADQLMTTGRVVHVWLGVEGNDLDGATATDLDIDGGAMVGQVQSGSPAERSGLAPRDVVVAIDRHPVHSMGELVVALRSRVPGEAVNLDVVRDRRHWSATVTLTERPIGS
jgi:S1-C subfamily serine protease